MNDSMPKLSMSKMSLLVKNKGKVQKKVEIKANERIERQNKTFGFGFDLTRYRYSMIWCITETKEIYQRNLEAWDEQDLGKSHFSSRGSASLAHSMSSFSSSLWLNIASASSPNIWEQKPLPGFNPSSSCIFSILSNAFVVLRWFESCNGGWQGGQEGGGSWELMGEWGNSGRQGNNKWAGTQGGNVGK